MKLSLVLGATATAIALVALDTSAVAGNTCGGDGGSSSGSSSSSSSSDDSDDSSSNDSSSEPACSEVSAVVGYTVCSRYGGWDAARRRHLRLTVGTTVQARSVGGLSMSGSANHPDSKASYRVTGDSDVGRVLGATFDVALTASVGRYFYVGLEGHVGALETSGFESASDDAAVSTTPASATALGAAIVGGVAAPLGNFTIRGELAAGLDAVGVTVDTRAGECESSETTFTTSAAVRPRLALETWLTPWMTVGGVVGKNLNERGETTLGIYLGGHLRAFDGAR